MSKWTKNQAKHRNKQINDAQAFLIDSQEKMGLSQRTLASILGVAQSQISRWISGKTRPTRLRFEDIKRRLG